MRRVEGTKKDIHPNVFIVPRRRQGGEFKGTDEFPEADDLSVCERHLAHIGFLYLEIHPLWVKTKGNHTK